MDMIGWIEKFLENENTKLLLILSLILIANIIDFMIGWFIAKFNPEIEFSTSKAILGIGRKITLLMLLIIFIPFSMLLPDIIGLGALYILYMGYLASELLSITGHLGITTDSKEGAFHDFLTIAFKGVNDKGVKK